MPTIAEITLRAPTGASVPGFLYEWTAEAITEFLKTHSPVVRDLGGLKRRDGSGAAVLGIHEHNAILFEALTTTKQLTMIVTTGAKVFQDAAFWRSLISANNVLDSRVILLDPQSASVQVLQDNSYRDKPQGFVREELETSIRALRSVREALPVGSTLDCFLIQDLPSHRVTLFDDDHAIVTPYLPGIRTGDETIFLDLQGEHARKTIAAYRAYCSGIAERARRIELEVGI